MSTLKRTPIPDPQNQTAGLTALEQLSAAFSQSQVEQDALIANHTALLSAVETDLGTATIRLDSRELPSLTTISSSIATHTAEIADLFSRQDGLLNRLLVNVLSYHPVPLPPPHRVSIPVAGKGNAHCVCHLLVDP